MLACTATSPLAPRPSRASAISGRDRGGRPALPAENPGVKGPGWKGPCVEVKAAAVPALFSLSLALHPGHLTAVLALAMSSICRCRSSISTSIALRAFTAAAQVNSDSSSWTQSHPTPGRDVRHSLGAGGLCRVFPGQREPRCSPSPPHPLTAPWGPPTAPRGRAHHAEALGTVVATRAFSLLPCHLPLQGLKNH